MLKNKKIEKLKAKEQGVSLYLAIVILAVLLGVSFGLSSILVGQIKITRGMGDSVVAFYAADTGIETELYNNSPTGTSYSGYLDLDGDGGGLPGDCPDTLQDSDDACYKVSVLAPGPDCDALNLCIKSVGVYKNTERAIEVVK